MDIETKRYRVRSIIFGDVQIIDKATNRSTTVPTSSLPSVTALALMSERAFDHLIAERIAG